MSAYRTKTDLTGERLPNVVAESFTTAFSKRITWWALIFIPLIVALFGTLYVNTFKDPTAQMKELPVAIVNMDASSSVDSERKNFGEELLDSILENEDVKWTKEPPSLVDDGLENSDYYMAVIIPEDFSGRITAGMTGEPEQANISFFKNVRKNYMLATLSTKIENELKETVNHEIGKQYTEAIASGLVEAKTGFADAAEGAQKLHDGAGDLADGVGALGGAIADAGSRTQNIIGGIGRLYSGAERLEGGADSLAEGTEKLNSATKKLPSSAKKLSDGIGAISSGVSSITAQMPTLLEAGTGIRNALIALKTPVGEMGALAETISTKSKEAADACSASASLSGDASADIQSAVDALTAQGMSSTSPAIMLLQKAQAEAKGAGTYSAAAANGLFSADPSAKTLYAAGAGVGQYASGIESKLGEDEDTAKSKTLIGIANSMNTGLDALDSGLDDADAALIKISAGAVTLSEKSSELADAIDKIDKGAAELSAKTPGIASGISELSSGFSALPRGLTKLQDGTSSLSSGARELASGARELKNGMDEGSETLGNALVAAPETLAEYVVQPVEITDSKYGDLEYFGYGFAPFFMTLCLWLGALLIFFVFEPFPLTPVLNRNRFRPVFGRWPLYFSMMALEIFAVVFAATRVGIPYANLPIFLSMFVCVGFTFICIMQFLNIFGLPGKALALLLLIVQFIGSSGTFPVVLGNRFATAISGMLPFTYTIDGFREIMSGSNMSTAYADMRNLLAFAAIAIALTLLCYPRAWKAKLRRDAVAST